MLTRLRIPTRLYAGYGLALCVSICLGLVAFLTMSSAVDQFHAYESEVDTARLLADIQEDVTEARLAAFGWRATGAQAKADEVAQNLAEVVRDAGQLAQINPALGGRLGELAEQYLVEFDQALAYQATRNRAFSEYRAAAAQLLNQQDGDLRQIGQAVFAAERFLLDNNLEDAEAAKAQLQRLVDTGQAPAGLGSRFVDRLDAVEQAIDARNTVFSESLDLIGPEMLLLSETEADQLTASAYELRLQTVGALELSQAVIVGIALFGTAIVAVGAFLIANSIVPPLAALLRGTKRLEAGELERPMRGVDRHDEIGDLAAAMDAFRKQLMEGEELRYEREAMQRAEAERAHRLNNLVEQFQSEVGGAVDNVDEFARSLRDASAEMSRSMSASEETTTTVAANSEEASASVQTVASSAEELGASIGEIQRVSDQVNELVSGAVSRADTARSDLEEMESAVSDMVASIELINSVAEQTNLLALNATIEAARAGEAGKGFAVVASEVKTLANQAQHLNEQIADKVRGVKERSTDVSRATTEIIEALEGIRGQSTATATVVAQQGGAVREIASAAQEAAEGARQTAEHVSGIRAAASKASDESQSVAEIGEQLESRAGELRRSVTAFLKAVEVA